jgi:hypothetical protein
MDRAGMVREERAGRAFAVPGALFKHPRPDIRCELFRYVPCEAGQFMGIKRDVRLMATDIAVLAASELFFFFFFRITDGDRDAGVGYGAGVEERG